MHRSRFARHLCLAVDAKGYGSRDNVAQFGVQRDLPMLLDEAAAAAGLDRSAWRRQPQGDGEIALIPPEQPEPRVVDDFVRELDAVLALFNHDKQPETRLRLRLALHFGVAYDAPSGFAGEAVVVTARLVASEALHRALAEAGEADLAVALSDRVYMDTVRQRHTSLQPPQFGRIEVSEKEYSGSAWVRVLFRGAAPATGADGVGRSTPEPHNATAAGGGAGDTPAAVRSPTVRSAAARGVENNFYGDVQDVGVIGIGTVDRGERWR